MTRGMDRRSAASTVLAALLVVALSWIVRALIERAFVLGESVSLIGATIRLSRGENSGVAFGFLRGSPIVLWLSAAGVILLAFYAFQQRSRLASVAAGLILGGGLANLIDRVADGRVTDYIDVTVYSWHYPTFNLPDIAITTGFIVLLGTLAFAHDDQRAGDESHDTLTTVASSERGMLPKGGPRNAIREDVAKIE